MVISLYPKKRIFRILHIPRAYARGISEEDLTLDDFQNMFGEAEEPPKSKPGESDEAALKASLQKFDDMMLGDPFGEPKGSEAKNFTPKPPTVSRDAGKPKLKQKGKTITKKEKPKEKPWWKFWG